MMAALFLRGPVRWRSMQLKLALIFPPTNHLANGSFHSSTLFQRWNQCNDSACSAQKPSGSAAARFQSFSKSARLLMCALSAKSAGGGNFLVSFRTLVIFVPLLITSLLSFVMAILKYLRSNGKDEWCLR